MHCPLVEVRVEMGPIDEQKIVMLGPEFDRVVLAARVATLAALTKETLAVNRPIRRSGPTTDFLVSGDTVTQCSIQLQ